MGRTTNKSTCNEISKLMLLCMYIWVSCEMVHFLSNFCKLHFTCFRHDFIETNGDNLTLCIPLLSYLTYSLLYLDPTQVPTYICHEEVSQKFLIIFVLRENFQKAKKSLINMKTLGENFTNILFTHYLFCSCNFMLYGILNNL